MFQCFLRFKKYRVVKLVIVTRYNTENYMECCDV